MLSTTRIFSVLLICATVACFSSFDMHVVWAQESDTVGKLTTEEQAWLAKKHTVRVRVTDQAPYIYAKNDEAVGIAADLINAISERTGIKFHFVIPSPPFAADLRGLIQHTGPDLFGSLTPTPEREEKILFTKPYISSPKFIFTQSDAEFVASMENLTGKTVAVIKDYLVHKELAKKYPDINLVFCKNNREALTAVSSGKAFAFIGSMLATPFMINEFGLKNLKASAPSALQDATVAMAVRSDWPELRDIINKVFEAMPENEKAAIINKWSTVKVEYGIRPGDILKWVLVVAGAASFLILLFVFWNRSLAKQVKRRTAELGSTVEHLSAEMAERKQAEHERDRILDLSYDLICIAGMDGYFKYVNPAWEKILGYSQDELLARPFLDFIHPDDNARTDAEMEKLGAGHATIDFENRYIHKNGSIRHVSWVATPLPEEKEIYCIGRDITARKEAEERLQEYQQRLKALASQLTITEEKERRVIAADLHDHVGHSLALARMQLNTLLETKSEMERNILVKDISNILLKALQDTRSLIFELSSPSINEIGLAAAISEWLEDHIEKRHGLKTEFIDDIDDKHNKAMDENVRALLFRNVRELLTNVVKHARANTVRVHLTDDANGVTIVIEDDGVGFDPEAIKTRKGKTGGFGLFSIQERMADLGGAFEIVSEPGKGCKVIMTAPLKTGRD